MAAARETPEAAERPSQMNRVPAYAPGLGPFSTPASRTGSGGGSYPPGLNGWQRQTRLTASQLPRPAPCKRRHSAAYREQDGWNRHTGPISFESVS